MKHTRLEEESNTVDKTHLPVVLFNGTVATTNGLYEITDIDVDTAKTYIACYGFVSAIGHQATAEIISENIGQLVPMNRIQFEQQVGQIAIVFKLNKRPPEGTILNRKEIEAIGYSLKKMERIQ